MPSTTPCTDRRGVSLAAASKSENFSVDDPAFSTRSGRSGACVTIRRQNKSWPGGRISHGDTAAVVNEGAGGDRRVLARGELPVGRADLSVRQSPAQGAAEHPSHQAPPARPLRDDSRDQSHLRPPESGDPCPESEHHLYSGSRAWRPRR